MRIPQRPPGIGDVPEGLLIEMLQSRDALAIAKDFNRRYLHWEEIRYRDIGRNDHAVIWALMKILRSDGQKELIFGKTQIRYSFIRDFMRIVHEIDTISSAGLFSEENMTKKSRIVYAASSVMEESIASSQIEGASTTLSLAKKMLRENRAPRNRSERMIFNNYNAMNFIRRRKDEPLTPDLILEAHRIITKGTLEDEGYEGRLRDNDDIVVQDALTGDVYHTPMSFEDISASIQSVCEYANDDSEFEHPIIKGIILHFMMAYIHPFMDGNGRLARALFYWYALKKGYWSVEFLSISKAIKKHRGKYDLSYLLSETDDNDVTYFIKFNLDQIKTAFDTFKRYVKRKLKEQKEMEQSIVSNPDFNLRQRSVLMDAMKSDEPFSVYSVQKKYQVSYQTARTDIQKLIASGYIKVSGRKGNMALYRYDKTNDRTIPLQKSLQSILISEKL